MNRPNLRLSDIEFVSRVLWPRYMDPSSRHVMKWHIENVSHPDRVVKTYLERWGKWRTQLGS